MENIKLVNTTLNNYFENNKLEIRNNLPTEGTYRVGDIIIKETQVPNMAIGWICVTAGTPGVWSEFGGEPGEQKDIVLNSESVGMNELTSEVKSKLLLINTVNINVQLLQDAVNKCATKEELYNIDLSRFATKEELYNIDLSKYATVESVSTINSNTGDLSLLKTNDTTNLVSAINEVFQSGNNVKQQLVDALVAKGVDCSTSNTFEELIEMIEELSNGGAFEDWTTPADSWLKTTACAPIPTANYNFGIASHNEKVYCIGGISNINLNRAYNTKTNTWELMSQMTTGRFGLGATIIGNDIYCIGGYQKYATNEVYNTKYDYWVPLKDMPTARGYLAVEAIGTNNIYAIGGTTGSDYLMVNEMYDTYTDSWTTKNNMPTGTYQHASTVVDNKIYCMGGYTGSLSKNNYCYDPTTDTWTTLTQVTAARRSASCASYNNKIYYMFGNNASSTCYKTNYCYDISTNAWTTLTAGPATSMGRGAVAINGMIFVFGGYNGSAITTVDCYII